MDAALGEAAMVRLGFGRRGAGDDPALYGRPMPGARLLAAAVALAVVAAGCGQPPRHYLPGVVDDALSGALIYDHLIPPGPYGLGGGPGNDARGCRTTSAGAGGPPGSPGTRFACLEDFDAAGTADHVAVGFDVQADQRGCWRARVSSLSFVVEDQRGPTPGPSRFPVEIDRCGLAAVEQG